MTLVRPPARPETKLVNDTTWVLFSQGCEAIDAIRPLLWTLVKEIVEALANLLGERAERC